MKRRDQIIYGTLLHDVGKFMQRAEVPCPGLTNDETQSRVCPFNRATGRFTHFHALWTEQFFEEYGSLFPDVTERFSRPEDNLVNLAAWHHKPSTAAQWIVTEAERMSSGMDRKSRDEDDESSGRHAYKRTHVRSLFARADLRRGPLPQGLWVHELAPLTPKRSVTFPKRVEAENASLVSAYRKLWEGFVEELGGLGRLRAQPALFCRQLLWLWEKYAWCVPSSTIDVPDISLYDHSRTAAGIAACLYDYHSPDTWNDHAIRDRTAEKFRLLAGDLSGIQRALFAFAPGRSKSVAKTLRARSFLLSLVSEAAIELALSRLDAHPTQVFMNAGGRFLVLLPNVPRLVPVLHDMRRVVEQWCRAHFSGCLTLNLDWDVTLRGSDFYGKRFRAVLEAVRERLEQAKKRKLAAVLMENGRWNDSGAFVLSERYARYPREGTCESCGQEPAEPTMPEDDGMRVGADCRDLRRIGRKLPDDRALVWDPRNADLTFFGDAVGIKLVNRTGLHGVGERIEEINAPDGAFPCRFMATHVPHLEAGQNPGLERPGDDEETGSLKIGDPLPFDEIAAQALHERPSDDGPDSICGVADLGVIKGDVDFLGRIFSDGMGEDFSISRYATLSRMLDLFFRGYLDTVTTHDFPNTYTVYAGGDDLLLITDWENALALADRLARDFGAYVCHNPNLTLSIGLAVTKSHFPVRLGANQAEACLSASKDAGRDRLTVFGETVTWQVFREKLEPYFRFLDGNVQNGEFGTAFLYRLLHYHRMHRELHAGKVERAVYRSRLSYDLKRNVEKRDAAGRVTNQAVLDELYRLFDLRTSDADVMNHLAIPLHWALYRNRQGG